MRLRPETWLSDLLTAATKVFIAGGYHRAQMADIAHEMGVSQGTLNTYVESKEALFLLVCQQGFSDTPIEPPEKPPIAALSFEAMLQKIAERRLAATQLNALRTALRHRNPVDARAALNGVLREFYSVLARNRRGFDLVERSAHEVPEMAQMLFVESRRKGIDGFERYLTNRIESGHFLPVPHVPTAARYIIETVSWFARHRHNTPDSQMPTDHDALETTIHFLVNTLIPAERKKRNRKPSRSTAKTSAADNAPQRQ